MSASVRVVIQLVSAITGVVVRTNCPSLVSPADGR